MLPEDPSSFRRGLSAVVTILAILLIVVFTFLALLALSSCTAYMGPNYDEDGGFPDSNSGLFGGGRYDRSVTSVLSPDCETPGAGAWVRQGHLIDTNCPAVWVDSSPKTIVLEPNAVDPSLPPDIAPLWKRVCVQKWEGCRLRMSCNDAYVEGSYRSEKDATVRTSSSTGNLQDIVYFDGIVISWGCFSLVHYRHVRRAE